MGRIDKGAVFPDDATPELGSEVQVRGKEGREGILSRGCYMDKGPKLRDILCV